MLLCCWLLGHVPCRAGADGWWGAGNDVAGDHFPHNVGDHKGKGKSTSYVMLGTLVSGLGLGLDVLEPGLEVGSRVGGEGVGKGDCQVGLRHVGWVDGWMNGWVKTGLMSNFNC